jgi:hypothetical protein
MIEIANEACSQISGGDRWGDTPEGRATVDGGRGSQNGPIEICTDTGYRINGKEVEVCVITREAKK